MTWGTRAGASIVAIATVGGVGASMSIAATTTVTKYATGTTNVRSGASTSNAVVGSIAAGTKVTGAQQTNGWIKIATPANFAGKYVSGSVLSSTAPAAPKPAPTSGRVTAWIASLDHTVRVRKAPNFTSTVVARLGSATQVSGTLQGDWLKTPSGYVNKGTLVFSPPKPLNARLSQSSLCMIPLEFNTKQNVDGPKGPSTVTPKTPRYLNCTALASLKKLESGYRSAFGHYAEIDLAYRDWNEQTYWYNKLGREFANRPGTSPHGFGVAVDFREDDGTKNEFFWGRSGYNWLAKNASAYGFEGDPVPYGKAHESYHWNFTG